MFRPYRSSARAASHAVPGRVRPYPALLWRTERGNRGSAPPRAASWLAARTESVARWRVIQDALDLAPPKELLHQLTSMTALCERAEELFQQGPAPSPAARVSASRCQFCPLFYALGGHTED